MEVLVCIDDTDSLEYGSTGKLAQYLIDVLEERGLGKGSYITRHQLYVHEDIPYTSHNSSMCFIMECQKDEYENIIQTSIEVLLDKSVEGSDPGLCVARYEDIKGKLELIKEYGKRAKKEVLTKKNAYDTAKELGIHLSEHGGTGQGVVGALAGIGLRLGGNDGRIRGKVEITTEDGYITAGELLKLTDVEIIEGLNGEKIDLDDKIKLGEKIKAVFLYGTKALLVYKKYDQDLKKELWHTIDREHYINY